MRIKGLHRRLCYKTSRQHRQSMRRESHLKAAALCRCQCQSAYNRKNNELLADNETKSHQKAAALSRCQCQSGINSKVYEDRMKLLG